jgi:hypothetical protein
MATLTIAMPYYNNPGMLSRHYRNWLAWPGKYRNALKIIIVDDGSPEPAANVPRPYGLPEIEIYRVTEDRPWHQHAARNLAMSVAEGWVLLTDMDHMLTDPAPLFKALPTLDEGASYTLDRVEADTGEPTLGKDGKPKPHPNTFLLTRALYWRIGGYDEDYCGIYGTDKLFRDRREKLPTGHIKAPLTRYWRDLVPDASTQGPRKEGRKPGEKQRVLADKIARGEADKIVTLDFPWERVV